MTRLLLPGTVDLGADFQDHCTAASGTPVEATTWGKIKTLYR